ncbi:peptidase inhibitor family I36 protein [Streptomyces tubbatahanensis]|uniref:Peptidase inhibitor family I36 protein n=1 Tax=Streptomyces tubbatahanensis TaxID=2923272 RepID=A0ABY3Y2F2_9ACTN|nr:peptidase inhibitor family I36 protein [Streptomyces tubbatahanensis]UNT00970.1 peptidase inhibitor family I36 protein [Streptomyces tubbatahanensis]
MAALATAALAVAAQPVGAETAAAEQAGARQAAAPARAGAGPELGKCGTGELCLWKQARFKGKPRTYELRGIDIESCTPVPDGAAVESAANRTGRPVTLYQSEECAETAEFDTYPSGSWTPELPYKARAFKVWEH